MYLLCSGYTAPLSEACAGSQSFTLSHTCKLSPIRLTDIDQLDSEFIANVTRLIEDHVEQEKIDVGFLSDALSMSNSTLYRKIKALTGISTNEFIRKIKMSRAEQLLLTGKFTVSEVGYQVGMNSPVYFRQCFKEEFGMVPSDYLKKVKDYD